MLQRSNAWMKPIRTAVALGSKTFLDDITGDLSKHGVIEAVEKRDTATIADWLVTIFALQGVSDRAAMAFASRNPIFRLTEFLPRIATAECGRLRSYWAFADCGFQKTANNCACPDLLDRCPVARTPMRNGRLARGAASLALFIRDVCDDDLVGWIDQRLALGGTGHPASRAAAMTQAVLEPLTNIFGVSSKVWSIALADLLLCGDSRRERWVAAGAAMIAVDSLVHAFLQRTGGLAATGRLHPYGPACYAPGGCAELIAEVAASVDASAFNPAFPAHFPRFVQHSIWRFCAESGWAICNGRRIDDRFRCRDRFCSAGADCARMTPDFSIRHRPEARILDP